MQLTQKKGMVIIMKHKHFVRLLSSLLAVIMLVSSFTALSASAWDPYPPLIVNPNPDIPVSWSYDEGDFTIEEKYYDITEYHIYYNGNDQEIVIPDYYHLYGGSEEEPIKKIDGLYGEGVKKLTLPTTLKELGDSAFRYMTSLESVEISKDNPYFTTENGILYNKDMTKLLYYPCQKADNSYAIPETVTGISANAFYQCENLKNLTLSNGIKYMDSGLISDSVETITIGKGCSFLSAASFSEHVKRVDVSSENPYFASVDGVLFNKQKTELIYYPAQLEGASYTVPDSVKAIGNYAFANNAHLNELTLRSSLNSIGKYALYQSKGIQELNLPNSLKELNRYAFSKSALRTVNIPAGITEIQRNLFDGSQLESIEIPETVTIIREEAFRDCVNLEKVTVPGTVSVLEDALFEKCTSLRDVYLNEGTLSIGAGVFANIGYNYTNPLHITVPRSVTSIDYYSFFGTCQIVFHGYKDTAAEEYAINQTGYTGWTPSFSFEEISDPLQPEDIAGAEITINGGEQVYDGSPKTPSVTVTYNGAELRKEIDYTLSYSDNITAGNKAKVTVTGIGTFTGTATKSFTISAKSLDNAQLSVEPVSFIYDGTAKTPKVTVSLDGVTLVQDADYTVSYKKNTEVGVCNAEVTGKGNYQGRKNINFRIIKRALDDAAIKVDDTGLEYNGSAKIPSVKVTYGGTMLKENTDYTLSYQNNINAGSSAEVTVKGIGVYEGSRTQSFTIKRKALSWDDIKITTTSENPTITVKSDGKTLTRDQDYTVTVTVEDRDVKVRIVGIGNYSGSFYSIYTLQKIAFSADDVCLSPESYTYDGKAKTPAVTVTVNGVDLREGVDYELSYEDNTNAGRARVRVSGIGNYTGLVIKSFRIEPRDLNGATVNLQSGQWIYDGQEKTPPVTAKYGSTVLTENTDFRVAYTDNINAGKGTATITGIGNYTGKVTRTFTISPKNVSELDIRVQNSNLVYNGYTQSPVISVYDGATQLTEGYDYKVTSSMAVNVGDASVTLIGQNNYTGSRTVSFSISAVSLTNAEVIPDTKVYTYDGTAKKPGVSVKLNGVYLAASCYTVSYSGNINAGEAKITVTGKGNCSGSAQGSFTINKKSLKGAKIELYPTSYTYDGKAKKPTVTVTDGSKKLTLNTDYTVTYENNTQAGSAKAKAKGAGNYTDSVTAVFEIKLEKKPFQWGTDNLNFNNTGEGSFGVEYVIVYDQNGNPVYDKKGNVKKQAVTTHRQLMTQTYIDALKQNMTNKGYALLTGTDSLIIELNGVNKKFIYNSNYLDRAWGGSCYGMSVVNLLGHYGYFPYSQYQSGANSVHDFSKPKNNQKVRDLIEYYHMTQREVSAQQRSLRNHYEGSHASNINLILSELKQYGIVLVCYAQPDWGGHAVIAYSSGDCSIEINKHTYTHYIAICDPNASSGTNPNSNAYIYYDDQYNWIIPRYKIDSSDNKAYFSDIVGDPELINESGYHKKTTTANSSNSYIARLNTYEAAEQYSVEKCEIINGNDVTAGAPEINMHDIFAGEEFEYAGDDSGVKGCTMFDSDIGYRFTQSASQETALSMDYENTYLTAYSESAESVVFDRNGYVSISGDKAAYQMSILAEEDYPTDWFNVTVEGKASDATIRMTGEGYILTADDLQNVHVVANNKNITAQTTFSTDAGSVLIYEVDRSTIGVMADTDNDGIFESEVSTDTKSLDNCTLELSERNMIYNSETPSKPEVTLSDGDNTLLEEEDYIVRYENADGEGVAKVTVIGINGYSGSLTTSYFIEGSVKLGDVNGDKIVNAADRAALARYVAKWKDIEITETAADVNLDGKINALDRIILTRHVEKKPSYLQLPVDS